MCEGRGRYTPGETAPGAIMPVIQRFHSDGNCSITGGVVVRDPVLSALERALRVRRLLPRRHRVRPHQRPEGAGRAQDGLKVDSLSSFGEDARGRVVRDLAGRPGLPARSALTVAELADHGVVLIRADNPSPLTLTGTNTWVVSGWVIDPGPAIDAHLDAVAAAGDVQGIALTHDHDDHVEGVDGLRERVGDVPVVSARTGSTGGDRVGPLEVVALPGHADDHLVFVAGRAAFTGDAVLGEGSVFVTGGWRSTSTACASCATATSRCSCPGHGRRSGTSRGKLDEYLAHRLDRERGCSPRSIAALRSEDELLDAAWDDAPEQRPAVRGGRRCARTCEKLRDEGRA